SPTPEANSPFELEKESIRFAERRPLRPDGAELFHYGHEVVQDLVGVPCALRAHGHTALGGERMRCGLSGAHSATHAKEASGRRVGSTLRPLPCSMSRDLCAAVHGCLPDPGCGADC